jgi:pimeloyl-ACP methyl ester carboxylesterase
VTVSFVEIDWAGRPVSIEFEWVGVGDAQAPLIVFLHEGLGSVSMWKDFPEKLCAAVGARGLVYSRPGYGRSTPRAADEVWASDFMHRQAFEVLLALLVALGIDASTAKPWLFGHSDGGSIALLYAARFADRVRGAVVLAPHIVVEDISVRNIQQARVAYEQGDLKRGLARHHADPDSAFWGWNRIWLDPVFRHWNITPALASITCPLLAVQGEDDEYGTLAQIRGIRLAAPQTQLLELANCGHSPHRDQPAALIAAATTFIQQHNRDNA